MLRSIKYNLSHLLDFSGRDARQTFWYYVLFLFLVNMVLGMVLAGVMIASMVGPVIDAAQAGLPEEATRAMIAGQMSGMMGQILWGSLAGSVLMCLLLAAAFVRRLHDSNSSGWWGLLALAAQLGGALVSIRMMGAMQGIMTETMGRSSPMTPLEMQALMQSSHISLYGLIGWIAPLVVIVFGVIDSTDGPNRFGEGPVRF